MGDELREVLASTASLIPFSIASNSARGLFAAVYIRIYKQEV